jgi:hypothetical protein
LGLTGKYDFKGIKKFGAKGILLALNAIPAVGKWLTKIPFLRTLVSGASELFVNWLANNGLMVINIGAIAIDGVIDQNRFDNAIEDGLAKIRIPGATPEQKKAIDDEVINAIRKFGRVTRRN